jgi:hypothetical protein
MRIILEYSVLGRRGPLPPYMKLLVDSVVEFVYGTDSGTAFGHKNTALGASVVAASCAETPPYGTSDVGTSPHGY